ncbi:MAG: hypothetical protein EKK34_29275 [Mycobacterium sp.]|nr:MAG: hypothetical protein EKK34_29275 [Mycobacterium sp.]
MAITPPPSGWQPGPPAAGPPYPPYTGPQLQAKRKNPLGLIALIVGIVGFIFACIPGALIVGRVLLPIAFILGIVRLFQSGRAKDQLTGANWKRHRRHMRQLAFSS